MNYKWLLVALVGTLLVVEGTSFRKLGGFFNWTSESVLAYTSALAFVVLLLGAIVALSLDIPSSIRRQFRIGGYCLFAVQALANILESYRYGLTFMPVEIVTGFFGIPSDLALKSISVIQGGTLSLTSIAFWSLAGELLRRQRSERQQQRAQLQNLEEFLKEVAK